jgi:peptidoglycan/LPS O-acetylase OafA/YrhL/lysophospholipase L1-like esterase
MQQMVGRARSLALDSAQLVRGHGHLSGLDGLRAIAVIAVFLFHADLTWARGGYLGVDLFFVISGFLITGLLIGEIERTGRLSLKDFYLRRARRLLPASWVMIAAAVIAATLLAPDALPRLRYDAVAAFFYVTNWELLVAGRSYFEAIGRQPLLLHLWSLAIEEQFYIVWAPLVLVFGTRFRPRLLVGLALVLAIGSAGWMAAEAARMDYPDEGDPTRLYFGTDTHGFSLLFGALLGLLWRPERLAAMGPIQGAAIVAAGSAALALLLLLFFALDESSDWLYPWGFLLAVAASAAVIGAATLPKSGLGFLLDREPLRWIGERSYGLYLWHWPIFMVTRPGIDLPWPGAAVFGLRAALTLLFAALSYRFVEMPVRQGAVGRFVAALHADDGNARGQRLPRFAAVLLGVIATIACAGGILMASPHAPAVSKDVLDAVGPLRSAEPPPRPALIAPAIPTPGIQTPTVAKRPVLAIASPPVIPLQTDGLTAVGDSVLLGASRQLLRAVPGAEVYATVGWQASDVLKEIVALHDQGALRPVVLIHTGTNGYVKEKQLRKLLALLADRKRVLVVNTHVPRRWMDANNDMIGRVVPDFPNAAIVDWRDLSSDQPHYFVSDGVHLTISGQKAFVAEIMKMGHFAVGATRGVPTTPKATTETEVAATDAEDDVTEDVSHPPLLPPRMAKAATAVAVALAVAAPSGSPADANPPGAGAGGPSDLTCPHLAAPAEPPRAGPVVTEMPAASTLGTLARMTPKAPPVLDLSQIPAFNLRDGTTGAPRSRSLAFWGDSHIAAGPFMNQMAQNLRNHGETVGMRFLPPTMGRTNVRLPIRAYCIGRAWTTDLAYREPGAIETGPGLVTRSAAASAESYLWLDLRNAEREPTLKAVEIVYRPGATETALAISINDGPERSYPLEVSQAGGAAPTEVVKLGGDAPISTLKLRVYEGRLDLFGFVLDYETDPAITLDVFGVPSSEVRGWANADPDYVVQALHGVSYDAVVLEYGTNEGNDPHFDADNYAATLRAALTNMRRALPKASCVLIGPPDRGALSGAGSTRPGAFDLLRFSRIHASISSIQAKLGPEFGCVAWNWQGFMGGLGGSYGWARNTPALMGPDLTHLTPEGYRRTADALTNSLGWESETTAPEHSVVAPAEP